MKNEILRSREMKTAVRRVPMIFISAAVSALSCMMLILICGSTVILPVSAFCAAVLCLLPASVAKIYAYFMRVNSRSAVTALTIMGYLLSVWFTLCYYISHDYDLRVYRYMKQSGADVYYFGGYESYKEDYSGAEDYMKQMKSAPASIVLEGMSEDKLGRLSADELAEINSESLWDYCGFGDILGSAPAEVESSMSAAKDMNAYEFTFEYRGLHAKTFGYMLSHPKLTFEELGFIAKKGSHTVNPGTLILFMLAQIFIIWIVGMRFLITKDRGIIYISEPIKKHKEKTRV